ncbi:MAG TPA: TMEM175 family protein [Methanospirillum sp.]|nr:TMEM175 family protein [Methanospirillum sp.]
MDISPGASGYRYRGEGPVTKTNLGRLTNSIFVFTLLYLFKNIQIPTYGEAETPGYLATYFTRITPEALNFVNAFLVVGILWILAFHIIHLMSRVDHKTLFIHFSMLMTLVFIPVSSMIADDFPGQPLCSFILHTNILFTSLLLLLEWRHITSSGIIVSGVGETEIRATWRRLLFLTAAASLGCILTIQGENGTRFLYIIVMITLFGDSVITDWRSYQNRAKRTSADPPPPVPISQVSSYRGPVGQDMLEIMINGVFGFSMTLIVKNIPLPAAADIQNIDLILEFVIRVLSDGVEFIFAFIILAILWSLTFELMRWMKAVDLTFVSIELFGLLALVFIPVTSILHSYFGDDSTISILLGLNIIICSVILLIQWYYISIQNEIRATDCAESSAGVKRTIMEGRQVSSIRWGSQYPFIRIRNRILILPIVTLFWLGANLFYARIEIFPALIGVLFFIAKSRE